METALAHSETPCAASTAGRGSEARWFLRSLMKEAKGECRELQSSAKELGRAGSKASKSKMGQRKYEDRKGHTNSKGQSPVGASTHALEQGSAIQM